MVKTKFEAPIIINGRAYILVDDVQRMLSELKRDFREINAKYDKKK